MADRRLELEKWETFKGQKRAPSPSCFGHRLHCPPAEVLPPVAVADVPYHRLHGAQREDNTQALLWCILQIVGKQQNPMTPLETYSLL